MVLLFSSPTGQEVSSSVIQHCLCEHFYTTFIEYSNWYLDINCIVQVTLSLNCISYENYYLALYLHQLQTSIGSKDCGQDTDIKASTDHHSLDNVNMNLSLLSRSTVVLFTASKVIRIGVGVCSNRSPPIESTNCPFQH